jgi:ribosome-associated heat shock protein Hsp15
VGTGLLSVSKGRKVYQEYKARQDMMSNTGNESLRADKWLWFTRFYKTRPLAAKAVGGGHVKINGARAKPSGNIRPGDVIEIVRDQLAWRMTAVSIPPRRGAASEMRLCYEEDADVKAQRQQMIVGRRMDRLLMPRTDGRPDKHTRRKLRDRRYD